MESELPKHDLSQKLINEEFFFIEDWLKGKKVDKAEARMVGEKDVSPDYTPREKSQDISENTHTTEQSTDLVAISILDEPAGASSKAAPPPYSFEDGGDLDANEGFSLWIGKAMEREANIRHLQRERYPQLGPHAYSWLPRSIQASYKNRIDVVSIMEANSFTVMAYETAPRCHEEIERLTGLLRIFGDNLGVETNTRVLGDALRTLKTMSSGIRKFTTLQDQSPIADKFSDLDVLDFEYSTAIAKDKQLKFPNKEFELAQKSYYMLVTYIMGLLEVLSVIFSGRTYTTMDLNDVEFLWTDKKMHVRTAWLEKQLAGWDEIEDAVKFCRDWRRLRSGFRKLALIALSEWQTAERMLSASHKNDIIELTVISARGLPKSNFILPTAWAKVVCYGTNRIDAPLRVSEHKTDVSQKTQNPVWGKFFRIEIPENPKMIDVEIFDHVVAMDNLLAKVRLPFSFMAGVEASFFGRSLIYSCNG